VDGDGFERIDDEVTRLATETSFSGVVRIDLQGRTTFARAFGMADVAHGIANTVGTRFGTASGAKGFTALVVVSLIEDGILGFETTARSLLGDDLPLIDDRVTLEQLLGHTSGIGDYLDEDQMDSVDDYAMPVPVHRLVTTEDYLAVLDGFPMVAEPGERFAYNNGGFVVLALLAERASGVPFHDLVRARVCEPAGMTATAYLRSDELPGDAALGYLGEGGDRTNVHHLPVLGTGDGGISTTVADLAAFWEAVFAGRIVTASNVEVMTRPRNIQPDGRRYGLGFHVHATLDDVVWLEGYDAGASFMSTCDPTRRLVHSVISNTSEGAWPMVNLVDRLMGTGDA
jgi:CubicO group peptidase (beta-lactamase class C family)